MCSKKCKCEKCQNFVGSQALIDKRRKMKDAPGAKFAMRVAAEAWQGPEAPRRMPHSAPRGIAPQPSPMGRAPERPEGMSTQPHMIQPSPATSAYAPYGPPPHGPSHPYAAMSRHLGYHPSVVMPPVAHGYMPYGAPPPHHPVAVALPPGPYGDPMQRGTPRISTPRGTSLLRGGYGSRARREKRQITPGEEVRS
jgi:hypothetical protein